MIEVSAAVGGVPMTKAILFDLWGTIVENGVYPSPVKQVKSMLRLRIRFVEFIKVFEDVFMTQKHENLSDGFRAVVTAFNVKTPDFVIDNMVGMWNKNSLLAKPFPEALETLDRLRGEGYKLGLITNTDPFSANQVIDKFELRDMFDVVMLSCEEGMLKTDEGFFSKALERLGTTAEETAMVGDSIESDVKAAQNAGVRAILIDRNGRREYDDKIASLDQLDGMLGDE